MRSLVSLSTIPHWVRDGMKRVSCKLFLKVLTLTLVTNVAARENDVLHD